MANQLETDIYVRFSETDAIGHVNNTSYFLYFEEARTKFFRTVFKNKPPSFSFIIANINCTYLNEAFFGDELQVITYVEKIGTKSFVTKQVLKNADTDISIAEAESVIVSYDYTNKQSIEIPEELLCNLKIYVKEN